MRKQHLMPIAMGLVNWPMMLWMAHGLIMGETGGMAGWALVTFVGAHLAVVVAALLGLRFALHWFPRVKLHRPSAQHFGIMLASAVCAAAIIHLLHGGVA